MNNAINKTLIVNMIAGPGVGKSTMTAAVFAELKMLGIKAEMVTEYAKGMTWQKSTRVLENQIYVFGKQHHYLTRPKDQVDVIVTDSPLLMSTIYDRENNEHLQKLILFEHEKMNNLNFFLVRSHEYQRVGRSQSEEEARLIDDKILNVLKENKIQYVEIVPSRDGVQKIVSEIERRLAENK